MFMCHAAPSRIIAAAAVTGVLPYYGTAPVGAAHTQALIFGLQFRGPTADRNNPAFTLTSGENVSMYYAYPVSYGEATFFDTDAQMEGGWDGALNYQETGLLGPDTVNVVIDGQTIPFYLYETDWPNLGLCHWKTY